MLSFSLRCLTLTDGSFSYLRAVVGLLLGLDRLIELLGYGEIGFELRNNGEGFTILTG